MSPNFRTEHDFLGEKQIPALAYWGVHTARAVENFAISGTRVSAMPELVRALAFVKKAATRANADLGAIDRDRAAAIILACEDLIDGKLLDEFVVDVIQGGAGTSTNMNANEVICNLALEKLGHEKGRYDVLHPNDHVNASQSTNDVYPTAVRLALWFAIGRLLESMAALRKSFEAKALEFKDILKIGRTQLQDAVPMTLGQEFLTYAIMIGEDEARLGRRARSSRKSTSAPPPSAPASTRRMAMPTSPASIWPSRPACRSSSRPTSSRPRRTPAPSCSCRACSSAWRAS